jgi:hypothetical protein
MQLPVQPFVTLKLQDLGIQTLAWSLPKPPLAKPFLDET